MKINEFVVGIAILALAYTGVVAFAYYRINQHNHEIEEAFKSRMLEARAEKVIEVDKPESDESELDKSESDEDESEDDAMSLNEVYAALTARIQRNEALLKDLNRKVDKLLEEKSK